MTVTCIVHGGETDSSDAIELPGGYACTRCYEWMEELVEDDLSDTEPTVLIIEIDDDDEDF